MTRGLKRHYVKAPAAQHELTHTQKKKETLYSIPILDVSSMKHRCSQELTILLLVEYSRQGCRKIIPLLGSFCKERIGKVVTLTANEFLFYTRGLIGRK